MWIDRNPDDGAALIRFQFDNGWWASLRVDPKRPAFGVSCLAAHDDGRRVGGPQEASDDEVAEWLAIVKEGFKA